MTKRGPSPLDGDSRRLIKYSTSSPEPSILCLRSGRLSFGFRSSTKRQRGFCGECPVKPAFVGCSNLR
ncbi:hypothetical protein TNCV_3035061 [Trichonephila clavipes]|nr:hypothetical protein TNCV_3035061 [Trichonephila clavipes]